MSRTSRPDSVGETPHEDTRVAFRTLIDAVAAGGLPGVAGGRKVLNVCSHLDGPRSGAVCLCRGRLEPDRTIDGMISCANRRGTLCGSPRWCTEQKQTRQRGGMADSHVRLLVCFAVDEAWITPMPRSLVRANPVPRPGFAARPYRAGATMWGLQCVKSGRNVQLIFLREAPITALQRLTFGCVKKAKPANGLSGCATKRVVRPRSRDEMAC